jgi:hypothetical protein
LAGLVPASHSSSIFQSFTQRLPRAHLRFARGSWAMESSGPPSMSGADAGRDSHLPQNTPHGRE